MQPSTARKVTLALILSIAAVVGFLTVGNFAGPILAAIFAYSISESYARPFTTLRESLRVNWRGFCLMAGIIGLIVLHFTLHLPEVDVAFRAFSAAFIGVMLGQMLGTILDGMVTKASPKEPEDKKKD